MLGIKTKPVVNIRETHDFWELLRGIRLWKRPLSTRILLTIPISGSPSNTSENRSKRTLVFSRTNSLHTPSPLLTSGTDSITDEHIAMDLLLYFQEHIQNLLSAFYSCFTNDALRKLIKEMVVRTIGETNALVHYLRI